MAWTVVSSESQYSSYEKQLAKTKRDEKENNQVKDLPDQFLCNSPHQLKLKGTFFLSYF